MEALLYILTGLVAIAVLFLGVTAVFQIIYPSENDVEYSNGLPEPLANISDHKNLCYDTETQIVYIIFRDSRGHKGYGYMSPYYAPNGKPYRYDAENQELVVIEER